jgi:hypothetical protein
MKKNYIKAAFAAILALFISGQQASAQSWNNLNGGITSYDPIGVYSLAYYNGNLYAGGAFQYAGSTPANNIAQWNGAAWTALGNGVDTDAAFGSVYAIAGYNNNIYIGGLFDSVGGIAAANIAQWNGTSWSAVGQNILGSGDTNYVSAMIVYNNNLIVGGSFSNASTINQWNGTSWSQMDTGYFGGAVAAFTVYNGNLYAGGYFYDSTNTIYGLAEWNGTAWVELAPINTIDPYGYDEVLSLTVYNGNLIVGGNFDSIGGQPITNLAQWDGTTWSAVGGGIQPTDSGYVYALATIADNLFVGGAFSAAGGTPASGLALWNGSAWTTPAALYPQQLGLAQNGQILALATDSDNLFVAGFFDSLGTTLAYNVGEALITTAIKPVTADGAISFYPNPNNGHFTVSLQNPSGEYVMNIYSITGDRISQTALNAGTTQLDLSSAAKGVYFYRITSTDGDVVSTGKIVTQ